MLSAKRVIRRTLAVGALWAALGCGAAWGADPAGASAGLQYKFVAGQKLVYLVTISTEKLEAKTTMTGYLVYDITNVDAGTGIITFKNHLDFTDTKVTPTSSDSNVRGGMPRPPMPPRWSNTPNYAWEREIQMDPKGKEIKSEGEMQLPNMLGDAWQLAVEPLTDSEKGNWTLAKDIYLVRKESGNQMFGPPFMRQQEESKQSSAAKETVTYTVGKTEGDIVTIAKKYELATKQMVGDDPETKQTGEGEIKFDTTKGVITELNEKFKIVETQKNVTIKEPTTVSLKLVPKEEWEKANAERKAKMDTLMANAKAAREAAEKPVALDDEALTQAIEDLESSDSGVKRRALQKLSKAVLVEKRRADVCKGIETLLEEEKDRWVIADAIKTLIMWGDKTNIPTFIKILDDYDDHFTRRDIIVYLGKTGDAAAATAVASWMTDLGLRGNVSAALIAIGPKAEDATLPLLKNHDMNVVVEACKVLGEIGTDKCVPPLKAIKKKNAFVVGDAASRALDAINKRKKAAAKDAETKGQGM